MKVLLLQAEVLTAPEAHWRDLLRRGIVGTPIGQGQEWMRAWEANNVADAVRNAEPGKRLIWC